MIKHCEEMPVGVGAGKKDGTLHIMKNKLKRGEMGNVLFIANDQ
jgi:hypothetical protein